MHSYISKNEYEKAWELLTNSNPSSATIHFLRTIIDAYLDHTEVNIQDRKALPKMYFCYKSKQTKKQRDDYSSPYHLPSTIL